MEMKPVEYQDFNTFYALQQIMNGEVKLRVYKSGYMDEMEYLHCKRDYKKYRVDPKQCSVVYTTNGTTYVEGKILGVNYKNRYFPVGKENQASIIYSFDLGEKFDFDRAKKIVEKRLFNPNPYWEISCDWED